MGVLAVSLEIMQFVTSTVRASHPGVPVMWYGHIRDLFPTAEGCMEPSAQCNKVALGTAKEMFWCHVCGVRVSDTDSTLE